MGSPDADGNIEPLPWFSHVIFSDDGGGTWELGGVAPADGGNECEVVEIGDGRLALNMRNQRREVAGKTVAGTQALPRGARVASVVVVGARAVAGHGAQLKRTPDRLRCFGRARDRIAAGAVNSAEV